MLNSCEKSILPRPQDSESKAHRSAKAFGRFVLRIKNGPRQH